MIIAIVARTLVLHVLTCRRCPWATEDDPCTLTQQAVHKHATGKPGGTGHNCNVMLHHPSRLHMGCPAQALPTVHDLVSEWNEISYPPTAVTTRVGGTMTPSEQAAVESRIAALEDEARRPSLCAFSGLLSVRHGQSFSSFAWRSLVAILPGLDQRGGMRSAVLQGTPSLSGLAVQCLQKPLLSLKATVNADG